MKKFLYIAILLLLSACSTETNSDLVATPTPPAPGRFDGVWTGTGRDESQGKDFEISFTVRQSRMTDIRYGFNGRDNIPCINLDYISLSAESQPQVTESPFSISLGEDLTSTIAFDSNDNASGDLVVHWHD